MAHRASHPATLSTTLALLWAATGPAVAGLCDYAPSKMLDRTRSGATATIDDARSALSQQAAGYFTLARDRDSDRDRNSGTTPLEQETSALAAHAVSGITTTATGAMLSGAAGLVGTVGAMLSAPVTALLGGVALVGVGAFEGACYFQVERVTDPYEVRTILENVAAHDPAVTIAETDDGLSLILTRSQDGPDTGTQSYPMRDLYIADGQLRHRDFGRDTTLGPILYAVAATPAAPATGQDAAEMPGDLKGETTGADTPETPAAPIGN